jgi:hypothetical protein
MMSNSTEQLAFNLLLKQRAEDIDSSKVALVSGDDLEKQVQDFFNSKAFVGNNHIEQTPQEPFSSLRGLFKGQSSLITRDDDRICAI